MGNRLVWANEFDSNVSTLSEIRCILLPVATVITNKIYFYIYLYI